MPIQTQVITGVLSAPDGTFLSGYFVRFRLSAYDATDNGVISATKTYTLPIQSDGSIAGDIWPNEAGEGGTFYQVHVLDDKQREREFLGKLQIGTDGPYDLADLIRSQSPTPNPSFIRVITQAEYDAIIQAASDAEQAASDATALVETVGALAELEALAAQTAADVVSAEAARDSSFANAKGAATIADARALVADNETFIVYAPAAETFDAYRRLTSTTQVLLGTYPSALLVHALAPAIGNVSAVLGQAYEEIERLSEAQQGDAYTLKLVLELASLIGALSDQVNGGQATLRGGTLVDPALRIGTVGIYSSANDTLSITIAGSEVARFTASGITIYGTVTEAP